MMNSACVMLPSPFLSCEGTKRASARTQTRAHTHTDERAARATYSQRQNAPKGLHTLSRFLYRCLSLFHSVSLPPSLPPSPIHLYSSITSLYLYIPPCPSPPPCSRPRRCTDASVSAPRAPARSTATGFGRCCSGCGRGFSCGRRCSSRATTPRRDAVTPSCSVRCALRTCRGPATRPNPAGFGRPSMR